MKYKILELPGIKMLRAITVSRDVLGLILVLFVITVGFIVYELKYFSSPLLFGIDGPYYYIQVMNILNTGYLKYLDPPLAFYALATFSMIIGDIVIGIKIGSVILSLLGALVLYFLVKELGGVISGVVSAITYVFSAALIRMVFDLIKNAIGLVPLIASLLFTYLALRKHRFHYSVIASVLIIMTCLIHVLDFGVLTLFILLITIVVVIKHRDDAKFVLPQVIATLSLIIMGLLIMPEVVGNDLSKGLSFINELLKGKGTDILENPQSILTTLYPLLIGISGLILSMRFVRYKRYFVAITALIIIGLSIPFIPRNFLWRFNLVTLILTSPILSLFVGIQRGLKTKIALTFLVLGIIMPQFINQTLLLRPSIPEFEYKELEALIQISPPNAYFIAPDPRLKYWIETLTPRVALRPSAELREYPLIFIVELRDTKVNKPRLHVPPFAKLMFKGRFIEAYITHPPT